jgi:hypothetical protein
MFTKSRSLLIAAGLIAAPMAFTMAQTTNPTGNMGSNKSVTATPGTADSHAASGMNTGDAGARNTATPGYGTSMNNTKPGATGRTVVPGSTSSQASSSAATANQRTGSSGGSGGGTSGGSDGSGK